MKNLILFIILAALVCVGLVVNHKIEANYKNAVSMAANGEGTDTAIFEAMTEHHFSGDIFQEPTYLEKVSAYFAVIGQ